MKIKIYITSLMLFALGINLSFGQDIYEPNDTYETATPVTCGQELTAYIQVEGDIDWYEIEMTESGVLEVAVTSVPDNLDLNVEIHQVIDNILTLIADDRVNAAPGDNVFSNAVVNAGSYLIKVHVDWDNAFTDTDPYEMVLTCTPNVLELNQIYEEAASIPADTCFEANIYGDNHTYTVENDVDWFEVQLNSSGVLEIAVTSVPDNLDLNVEIHQVIDNVLTLIADDRVNAAPGDNVFSNAAVNPGTYLIKVHVDWDNYYNEETYSFCASFTPNALELNQIYEEAAPISMDTCFEANIYGDNHTYTVENDVDWFALEVVEDNFNLEIAITSVPDNLDLNLEVYQIIDNVLTLIADDGVNAAPGENVFVSTIVDAGTYLIKVHVDWNNFYNEDTYNFCLSFMDIDEQSLSHQLGVFPNPNNGRFSVKLITENSDLKILEVSVFDHLGRENTKLHEDTFDSNEVSLNMQNSTRGIYLIKIRTNQGVVTKKILVQ